MPAAPYISHLGYMHGAQARHGGFKLRTLPGRLLLGHVVGWQYSRVRSPIVVGRQGEFHVVSAYRLPEIGDASTIPCGTDEEIGAGVEAVLESLAKEIADEGVAVRTHACPQRAAAAGGAAYRRSARSLAQA